MIFSPFIEYVRAFARRYIALRSAVVIAAGLILCAPATAFAQSTSQSTTPLPWQTNSSNSTTGGVPADIFNTDSTGNSGGSSSGSNNTGSLVASGLTSAATCSISLFNIGGSLLGSAASTLLFVPVNDLQANTISTSNTVRDDFLNCIARSLARLILQQITASTVNWINSGFNGSPSFVQNPTQFFNNVADQAAGQFIQGSDLAFLCSPFALQVKIAVAAAYAYRNVQQCTLTSVTNNINAFMNRFDQGGWPAFISFTTMPTNNPFGAFMYAQAALTGNANNAVNQRSNDLVMGQGFLSFQQEQNCKDYGLVEGSAGLEAPPTSPNRTQTSIADGNGVRVCDLVTTTPGKAIESSLDQTLGSSFQSLNTAKYFDEIISALITQLIQRMLYGGLSGLSNNGGYQNNFSVNVGGAGVGDNLSQNIESMMQPLENIWLTEKSNISQIETALPQLQAASDCWQGVASSTSLSAVQEAQVLSNASSTAATVGHFQGLLSQYRSVLDNASSTLDALSALNTEALAATSVTTVESLTQGFLVISTSGRVATQGDVSTATGDSAKLQSDLSAATQTALASINQCRSFTPQT